MAISWNLGYVKLNHINKYLSFQGSYNSNPYILEKLKAINVATTASEEGDIIRSVVKENSNVRLIERIYLLTEANMAESDIEGIKSLADFLATWDVVAVATVNSDYAAIVDENELNDGCELVKIADRKMFDLGKYNEQKKKYTLYPYDDYGVHLANDTFPLLTFEEIKNQYLRKVKG